MFSMAADNANSPSDCSSSGSELPHALYIVLLLVWCLASRLPYVSDFPHMHKDGYLYIKSLELDPATYSVSMPGNIGYVLLGKVAQWVWPEPTDAFAAVTIALSTGAIVIIYLLGTQMLPRSLAASVAFALSCNIIVWRFSTPIASYVAWLLAIPAIGWFGIRYLRSRSTVDLVGTSLAVGLGSILRPDVLLFGGPLWLGCLLLARARFRHWLIGTGIIAACCCIWFFTTAAILGGPTEYLQRVFDKSVWTYSVSAYERGLFEGLLRNSSKYGLWIIWSCHVLLLAFLGGLIWYLSDLRKHWRAILLALLWVGLVLYFAIFVNAFVVPFVFPLLPLVYITAARGLQRLFSTERSRWPVTLMCLLALLSVAQYTLTPLRTEKNQRDEI